VLDSCVVSTNKVIFFLAFALVCYQGYVVMYMVSMLDLQSTGRGFEHILDVEAVRFMVHHMG